MLNQMLSVTTGRLNVFLRPGNKQNTKIPHDLLDHIKQRIKAAWYISTGLFQSLLVNWSKAS